MVHYQEIKQQYILTANMTALVYIHSQLRRLRNSLRSLRLIESLESAQSPNCTDLRRMAFCGNLKAEMFNGWSGHQSSPLHHKCPLMTGNGACFDKPYDKSQGIL